MKTAISVPNETFERASRRSSDLGMSRSEFFSRAAEHYLAELDAQSLSEQIDAAMDIVQGAGNSDDDVQAAVSVGRKTLAATDDVW